MRTPPPLVASLEELLEGATARRPMTSGDALSGSLLERVEIGDRRLVLKQLRLEDDWIMRATGDLGIRQLPLWSSGLLNDLPRAIDHAVQAVAVVAGTAGRSRLALLLDDVGELLVPEGSDLIPAAQHRDFLEHMAAMHAAYWGFSDSCGLMPRSHHFTFLTPQMTVLEAARGTTGVPPIVAAGWTRLEQVAPRTAPLLRRLAADPWPLVEALSATPATLIHADWKLGNLGSHPDGRTVVLDWAFPGAASWSLDLAWYLAVNCDLMPHTKEEAIDAYRDALLSRGVDVGSWWDQQLECGLLGALVFLGWSKTGAELDWWADRVERAVGYLP